MTRIDMENPSIVKLKRASIFIAQYNRKLLWQDEIQKRKIAADRMNKVSLVLLYFLFYYFGMNGAVDSYVRNG